MNLNRREALKYLSAGSLLALGLWPGSLRAKDNVGRFRFLAVNDIHYLSPACGAWLKALVQQMRTHTAVDFCLIAGDLTERGRMEDLATVRDIFKGLGMPVYVQIGNHDYTSQTDRRPYEKLFKNRINYFFKHEGWQFVGLDTTEGQHYSNTKIPSETFAWVRANLPKLDKAAPTIIFTHFPLAAKVRYRPANADELLELFLDYNLKAVVSGHWHGFTENQIGQTTLTTNRCCALKRHNHDNTTEKGYFLFAANEFGLNRTFVEFKPKMITY